ncbi:hypothetical protein SUGI_0325270 [Cryptomeria japonica]|nr:hypothetical protein SUGI_0325270 [Cryptomeria japonica]
MHSAFAVPSNHMELALWHIMDDSWLLGNRFLLPTKAASRFSSVVMDLTWSKSITKLLISSFVHPSPCTWDEVSAALAPFNIFARPPLIGEFLFKNEFVEDESIHRAILISFINGMMATSIAPFYA